MIISVIPQLPLDLVCYRVIHMTYLNLNVSNEKMIDFKLRIKTSLDENVYH